MEESDLSEKIEKTTELIIETIEMNKIPSEIALTSISLILITVSLGLKDSEFEDMIFQLVNSRKKAKEIEILQKTRSSNEPRVG